MKIYLIEVHTAVRPLTLNYGVVTRSDPLRSVQQNRGLVDVLENKCCKESERALENKRLLESSKVRGPDSMPSLQVLG